MLLRAKRNFILAPPAWVLRGSVPASLDFDFANSRYYQAGIGQSSDPTNRFLTVSRASSGYASDTAGNWVNFGTNVARIGAGNGLLVEEARTNSIRNNSMQGAVAGSPGTLPTNWFQANNTGLTANVVGTGTESGIDYIDISIIGTTTGTGQTIVFTDANTAIAALQGQTWTFSPFIKIQSGSAANITSIRLVVQENNAGGTAIAAGTSTPTLASSGALGLARQSFAYTTTNASTAFINSYFQVNISTGLAVNITLRIGWPQLELGSWATSPIRTTSAAVTRAADVVTVTSPPVFGSAYTLFGVGVPQAPTAFGTNQRLLDLTDGTNNNRLTIERINSTGASNIIYQVGGSVLLNEVNGTWAASASGKLIGTATSGSQQGAFNGVLYTGASGVGTITPTQINIGQRFDAAQAWNGYISRVAVWARTRLPNADLQRLTT